MKRVLALFGILAVLLVGCGKNNIAKTYKKSADNGILVTYSERTDGTWEYDGEVFQFRTELKGRMPNAESDSYFVVLTNDKDITFEDVSKSLYSSLLKDAYAMQDSVIVEMR